MKHDIRQVQTAFASLSPVNERVRIRLRLGAEELRQLREIGGDPPRLIPANSAAYNKSLSAQGFASTAGGVGEAAGRRGVS